MPRKCCYSLILSIVIVHFSCLRLYAREQEGVTLPFGDDVLRSEQAEKTDKSDAPYSPEKKVFFTVRMGQGGFRDSRSDIDKLGGGQVTLDIKPAKYPFALSISSEYYTNSPDPTHPYEIAGMAVLNALYVVRPFTSKRAQVFLGGGAGRLEVPKSEHDPEARVKGVVYNLEAGMNVKLFWKIGFYGVGKYLYARKKSGGVRVIDFSEYIVLLGFTFNFGLFTQ